MHKRVTMFWYFFLLIGLPIAAFTDPDTTKLQATVLLMVVLVCYPIVMKKALEKNVDYLFFWMIGATIAPYIALPVIFLKKISENTEPNWFGSKIYENPSCSVKSNNKVLLSKFAWAAIGFLLDSSTSSRSSSSSNSHNTSPLTVTGSHMSHIKLCTTCGFWGGTEREPINQGRDVKFNVKSYGKCYGKRKNFNQKCTDTCTGWEMWQRLRD